METGMDHCEVETSPFLAWERMTFLGEFGAGSFVPWIRRHADKLELRLVVSFCGSDRIEIDVAGPADLIDMLEIGGSLGPVDIWVETIRRAPIESGVDR
jgi:hypothetical protein